MPRIFRSAILLPDQALGPSGELRASGIARLLQDTATEASADAGFPPQWYGAHGTIWIVRRTTLEVAGTAAAGEQITIATWVADFRRVRSIREYAVSRGETEIARARTDWVYVDLAGSRPERVPQEMMMAFAPEEGTRAQPREALALPPPPADAFAVERRVELRDLDSLGHVNNTVYLDYLEDAAAQALAARGFGPDRWHAAGGHLRPTRLDVEYLDEARSGDVLQLRTWTMPIAGTSFERCTEIRAAAPAKILTRARTRWTWIAGGGETAAPQELEAALARGGAP